MSLTTFHLLFISASTLLALIAGAWGIQDYASGSSVGSLACGLASLAAVPALAIYGVRARLKLKRVEGTLE